MAPQRREFLELALGGALAAAGPRAGVSPASAEPLAQPTPFAADTVLKAAMALAASPYKAPDLPLPALFTGLTFEQYATIRRAPGTAIWANEKLGFSLEPLHRGFVYTTPVAINIVEGGLSQRLIYDPADYDFGKLQPTPSLGDIGFSGLRILSASDQGFEDTAIFQGASFYRSRARGQNFGVTARGLAIRTGDDPGEEFPTFREFSQDEQQGSFAPEAAGSGRAPPRPGIRARAVRARGRQEPGNGARIAARPVSRGTGDGA